MKNNKEKIRMFLPFSWVISAVISFAYINSHLVNTWIGMNKLSRDEVLSSSSGWVASLLNFFPGVGAGYLYQRRWIPYFLTVGAVTAWFVIGLILQGDKEPSRTEQLIGIAGLFLISIITVVEANLTFKKVVKIVTTKKEEPKSPAKKSWFN